MPRIHFDASMDQMILAGRAAKVPWHKLSKSMRLGRNTIIERARSIGVAVQKSTGTTSVPVELRRDGDDPPLKAGDPRSWSLLLGLTPSISDVAWPG